jgi:hypothetical protein
MRLRRPMPAAGTELLAVHDGRSPAYRPPTMRWVAAVDREARGARGACLRCVASRPHPAPRWCARHDARGRLGPVLTKAKRAVDRSDHELSQRTWRYASGRRRSRSLYVQRQSPQRRQRPAMQRARVPGRSARRSAPGCHRAISRDVHGVRTGEPRHDLRKSCHATLQVLLRAMPLSAAGRASSLLLWICSTRSTARRLAISVDRVHRERGPMRSAV